MLAELRALRAAHPQVAELATHVSYLEQRVAQLQYPAFAAAGWPIGSGSVESANKLVVEDRLKGAGMHWTDRQVNPMLALRNAVCNDRWETTWTGLEATQRRHAAQRRCATRRRRAAARHPAPARAPPTEAPAPPTGAAGDGASPGAATAGEPSLAPGVEHSAATRGGRGHLTCKNVCHTQYRPMSCYLRLKPVHYAGDTLSQGRC